MTRFGFVYRVMAVVLASTGCSDMSLDQCLESAVLERTAIEQNSGDWQAEVDSVIATAPADSVLDMVVFVGVRARADFETWAEDQDVLITYAFHGFSGYRVTLEVDDLTSLMSVSGVTGVDWGIGRIGPACR